MYGDCVWELGDDLECWRFRWLEMGEMKFLKSKCEATTLNRDDEIRSILLAR